MAGRIGSQDGTHGKRIRQLAPCLAASGFFAAMALLYVGGFQGPYQAILRGWGINGWSFPFLDTDTVLSAIRCVQKGVDVYRDNPCDVLQRVYDYSPLWLAIAYVPGVGDWRTTIGLCVDLAFLAALLMLPSTRDGRGAATLVLAAIASAPLYALERGNNDLVIFVLAATGATMIGRSRNARLMAYGAFLLAGLLKYYPLPLLVLATRERPARFFAIATIAATLLGLFVAIDGHDLLRALKLIPAGGAFEDMFGSTTVTKGLFKLYGWPIRLQWIPHLAMSLTAFGTASIIGSRPRLQADLDRLTEQERSFLFVGAVLISSFFFAAQNIGYRATHLLLVLPPLIALWQTTRRRPYAWAIAATFGLLWAEGVRHGVLIATSGLGDLAQGRIRFLEWVIRECGWWWLVTTVLSLAIASLLRSEMSRITLDAVRRLIGSWSEARRRAGAG